MFNPSHAQADKIFYSKVVNVTHDISRLITVSEILANVIKNPTVRRETLFPTQNYIVFVISVIREVSL